jgi:hypothetical protein
MKIMNNFPIQSRMKLIILISNIDFFQLSASTTRVRVMISDYCSRLLVFFLSLSFSFISFFFFEAIAFFR